MTNISNKIRNSKLMELVRYVSNEIIADEIHEFTRATRAERLFFSLSCVASVIGLIYVIIKIGG